nr:unnamed protein product [Callosobruchus analis]
MSIGWNPFYKNRKKSIETHVVHQFDGDFYGKELRVIILAFLRDEKNFSSLDELIEAINNDIDNNTLLEGSAEFHPSVIEKHQMDRKFSKQHNTEIRLGKVSSYVICNV